MRVTWIWGNEPDDGDRPHRTVPSPTDTTITIHHPTGIRSTGARATTKGHRHV